MLCLDLFIMRMHIKKVKSYIIYTYTEEDEGHMWIFLGGSEKKVRIPRLKSE